MATNLKPTNKVTAGALSAAIVTILTFIAGASGIIVDPSVATGITLVVSFIVSYFVKES